MQVCAWYSYCFLFHTKHLEFSFCFLAHAVKPVATQAPSNFLMMGLDFMVTADLQVQFIEVNNYPLWPRGTEFMDSMIQKMGVRG